jgi:transcriptional regulator with XRE-family HTH domain
MNVGGNIRAARVGKGLTQEELGKRLDRSRGRVNAWENGHSHPTLEMLRAIASVLDTTLIELVSAQRCTDKAS